MRLIVLGGSRKGRELHLPQTAGELTVGRGAGHALVFGQEDDVVSTTHASFRNAGDGRWILTDLGSSNGTFVNSRRIQSQELRPGDVIEFGLGGPTARFASDEVEVAAGQHQPTARVKKAGTVTRLLRDAQQVSASSGGRPTVMLKEFVRLAYQESGRKAKRNTLIVGMAAVVLTAGVWLRGELNQGEAEAEIARLTNQLSGEAETRQALQREVGRVQSEYAGLRESYGTLESQYGVLESQYGALRIEQAQQREQLANAAGFAEVVTSDYSDGVAFLSLEYGWTTPEGAFLTLKRCTNTSPLCDESETLELQETEERDEDGNPRLSPVFEAGGDGPLAFGGSISGTGFLVHRDGWILTNHHVAEPWWQQPERASLEESGFTPALRSALAYFPQGTAPHPVRIEAISGSADVAILRTTDGEVDAPALPLAGPDREPDIGEQIVVAGYPTGLDYVISARVLESDRPAIIEQAETEGDLLQVLVSRDLLYPFVALGDINDLTAEDIVHSANTYGGASGSPVFGQERTVVGIHYSSSYLNPGERPAEFVTKRAASIRHAWDIMPTELRSALPQP